MTEKKNFRSLVDDRLSAVTMTPRQQADLLRRAHEEEQPVKRKLSVSLAVALVLTLLAATACAVVIRFGALDYNAQLAENPEYARHILTLDETYDHEAFTMTLNDAVFDGSALSLTMNITPKEGAEPVFIYPIITASVGGKELEVDVEGGTGGNFLSGFWVPSKDPYTRTDGAYGVDCAIMRSEYDAANPYAPTEESVTWNVSFDVLKPLLPVEQDQTILYGDDTDESMEDYMVRFSDAYAQGRILLTSAGDLWEYLSIVPIPEGVDEETWYSARLNEQLVMAGLFQRQEQLIASFTTDGTELLTLDGENIFRFGDYEVVFHDLTASFSRVNYSFTLHKLTGGTTAAQDYMDKGLMWSFAVLPPDSGSISMHSSSAGVNETSMNGDLLYTGSLGLTAPATELTFVPVWGTGEPSAYDLTQGMPMTEEQAARSFTVHLK